MQEGVVPDARARGISGSVEFKPRGALLEKSVSVLVSLYNHEAFIVDTLESILRQSLMPQQIIVIDDGSTDGSVAAARSVDHPAISVTVEPLNLGGVTTVKGLSLCTGDYVAILNSDDVWEPRKLERQVDILSSQRSVGCVFTGVSVIDEDGRSWADGASPYQVVFREANKPREAWLRNFFLQGNSVCASSAVVRRECFEAVGPFDARYSQLQDLDMWVRIAMAGYDLHYISDPLTKYRVRRNGMNMSASNASTRSIFIWEFARILRTYWNLRSLKDLSAVFPGIAPDADVGDELALFYLARLAKAQPTLQHQLFALETMCEWAGNPAAAALATQLHGFGFSQYRGFMGLGPIRTLATRTLRHYVRAIAENVLPAPLRLAIQTRVAQYRRNQR